MTRTWTMWSGTRSLALLGLAAGAGAFLVALFSALGAPDQRISVAAAKAADATIVSRTVHIGKSRVAIRVLPSGTCFTIHDGVSTHACPARIGPTQSAFAVTPHGVGGVAGAQVQAVIVRLTRQGTVWAKLDGGAFYARFPKGYKARAVVKMLRDGSRHTFKA
jgi:hypothetical protein